MCPHTYTQMHTYTYSQIHTFTHGGVCACVYYVAEVVRGLLILLPCPLKTDYTSGQPYSLSFCLETGSVSLSSPALYSPPSFLSPRGSICMCHHTWLFGSGGRAWGIESRVLSC